MSLSARDLADQTINQITMELKCAYGTNNTATSTTHHHHIKAKRIPKSQLLSYQQRIKKLQRQIPSNSDLKFEEMKNMVQSIRNIHDLQIQNIGSKFISL